MTPRAVADDGFNATLQSLGVGDVALFPPAEGRSRDAGYVASVDLPAEAAQGPSTWYVIHLHIRVKVDPESGAGQLVVQAATNGRVAAGFEIEKRRDGSLQWTSGDLFSGLRKGSSSTGVIDESMDNYLQFSGVRSGQNDVAFSVQEFGDVHALEVRILGDSGISTVHESPDFIKPAGRLSPGSVVVGRTVEVPFGLASDQRSEFVARVHALGAGISAVGVEETVRFRDGRARGTVRFRPTRPGPLTVRARVLVPNRLPRVVLLGTVNAEPPRPVPWIEVALGTAGLVFGLAVVAVSRRRRMR